MSEMYETTAVATEEN